MDGLAWCLGVRARHEAEAEERGGEPVGATTGLPRRGRKGETSRWMCSAACQIWGAFGFSLPIF